MEQKVKQTRTPGYYWVRLPYAKNHVSAYWNGDEWLLHGVVGKYADTHFVSIGETPIKSHALAPELSRYPTLQDLDNLLKNNRHLVSYTYDESQDREYPYICGNSRHILRSPRVYKITYQIQYGNGAHDGFVSGTDKAEVFAKVIKIVELFA